MRSTLQRLGLLLASTAIVGMATAGEIYRWKDANGSTHIGSVPPAGVDASPLRTPKSTLGNDSANRSTPAPASYPRADAKQEEANEKVRAAVARQDADRERRCTLLRTNLAQIVNNPRVRLYDNGQSRKMGEEERQDMIGKTQQQIDANCNDSDSE